MSPVAFLDVNVPIYAAGRPNPLKGPCAQILALSAQHPKLFVTDAEVLQELIHHYLVLHRWSRQGRHVFLPFAKLMQGRVEPVFGSDAEEAARLADQYTGLGARDLLHAAVMKRLGITRVISADTDFDRLPDLERLDPSEVATWQDTLTEPEL